MRIYTEVNFEWDEKQGKLVEVSSESFDYNGEVILMRNRRTWVMGDVLYDAAGNKWYEKRFINAWGDVGEQTVWKNGVVQDTFKKGKGAAGAAGRFRQYVERKVSNYKGKPELAHKLWSEDEYSQEKFQQNWRQLYGPDKDIPATMSDAEEYLTGQKWYYQEGAESLSQTEYDALSDNDKSKYVEDAENTGMFLLKDEGHWTKDQQIDAAEKLGIERLKKEVKKFKDILDPAEQDAFDIQLQNIAENLEIKYEDPLLEAYQDLLGTDDVDSPLVQIKEDFIRDTGIELEDYATDVGDYETIHERNIADIGETKEEGLEGEIESRKESLKDVREQAKADIRAADAKIGAAGFASTGVGRTARDMLAEGLGEEARSIDEKMTTEMKSIREDYTTDYQRLIADRATELGKLSTDKHRNLSIYEEVRDAAAKAADDPWEQASKDYQEHLKTIGALDESTDKYTGELGLVAFSAEEALKDIQGEMQTILAEVQATEGLETFDPFAGELFDEGAVVGYGGFGELFDESVVTGAFNPVIEQFMDPITAKQDELPFYDPNFINNWIKDFSGGTSLPGDQETENKLGDI